MPDRGTWTEITALEELSTGSMPDGTAGRACLIAEHASVQGVNLIDSTTDIDGIFDDCELTTDLEDAQANGGSKFYCIVVTYAADYVTKDNIKTLMQSILDMGYEPEFWVIHKAVDKDFADKFEEALQAFQDAKRWFSGVCRFRKAIMHDLEGITTADGGDGSTTTLTITAHGYVENDQVVISGTENYDGVHTVLAASEADSLAIDADYVDETFPEDALVEEKPETYASKFSTAFNLFSSNKIMLVAPTNQLGHLGTVFGYGCAQSIEQSIGRRDEGGLSSVEVDPAYSVAVLKTLVAAGAVVLKRPIEKPEEIVINDDTVMWTSGSVKTWAQRRVICEAARSLFYYGNPLINSTKYPKTEAGAKAAAEEVGAGLKIMRDNSPAKISAFDLELKWITGGLEISWAIYDLNRLKIIENKITLKEAQAE